MSEASELRIKVNAWWETQIHDHPKRGTDCITGEDVRDYAIESEEELLACREAIERLLDKCLAFQVRQGVYFACHARYGKNVERFTWRIRWIHRMGTEDL